MAQPSPSPADRHADPHRPAMPRSTTGRPHETPPPALGQGGTGLSFPFPFPPEQADGPGRETSGR
mgnify:CR=1 FL=1